MTADASDALPLPGLELIDPERRAVGDVEAGVRRTLLALGAAGRLGETDAGHLAVAVSLSRIMARKEASGRLSTVSNDARLLVELLDSFVSEEDTDVDAALRAAMEEWRAMADDLTPQDTDSP